ncbi:MAG: RNA polymerase subunit sigma-70 [Rhodobacter sp.]|nr:RNA polymerase subunit sigma-70 [Rhodobacter sp.]
MKEPEQKIAAPPQGATGAQSRRSRTSPAIETALQRHYSDFRRFLARRVGDAATAEDVLQNFCMRVLQSGTELRDDNSAVGWLYTVLRSALTDHYRKEARRRGGNDRFVRDQLTLGETSVEPGQDAGLCGCVNGLILDLRPEYGELLRRVDFDEEPRDKVGTDLGISQKNLRVRLHRARQAVGELLRGHCSGCCDENFRDCFCELDCTVPAGEAQPRAGGLTPG